MTPTLNSDQIFNVTDETFETIALNIFNYQYQHVDVYRQYVDLLGINPSKIEHINQIPFLPISFFKSHEVSDRNKPMPTEHRLIFESSGTTGQIPSKHYVSDESMYQISFKRTFEHFFGKISKYCILGLLPSYLERGQSSLVYMVEHLMQESQHPQNGFFLHNHQHLHETLKELEQQNQATIVFGVTYALLDFAEQFPMALNSTQIIETGGMKGRREEWLRDEVHDQLKTAFSLPVIYSEYGMTELLSQAYSKGNGIFNCPAWMKIFMRDMNDPFQLLSSGRGAINVVDLANLHSCSFIATDDVGELLEQGSFKVNGRIDASELRGCSLMAV